MSGAYTNVPKLAPSQFGKNLLLSASSLGAAVVTGILLAPFLISRLGVAGYGLVPLINNLVAYLSVANIVLNSAVVRNVSLAIARDDRRTAIEVYSTAVWGSLAVSLLLVGIGVAAAVHAGALLNVPPGLETDATILFLTGTGSVVLTLLSSPLAIALYYTNRLDKKGQFDLFSKLTYAALTVLFVTHIGARPAVVGLALVVSAGVTLLQVALWSRSQMTWLRVRLTFSLNTFRELLSYGGWSLAAYLANLVFLSVDLVVVNRLLGPAEAGFYAALLQIPGVLRAFGTSTASVFSQPMAYIFGAEGARSLFHFARRSTRLTAFVVAIPVTVLCSLAPPLLNLWLGPQFASRSSILFILLFHVAYTLSALPIMTALQTLGRVREVGLLSCAAVILDALLAITLVKITSLGAVAVAAAGAVASTLLFAIAVPAYAAYAFEMKHSVLLKDMLRCVGFSAVALCVGAAARTMFEPTSVFATLVCALLLATVVAVFGALALLERDDRTFVAAMIRSLVSKRQPSSRVA